VVKNGSDAAPDQRARWERRRAWATALRVLVFSAPIAASFAAAWAVRTQLPTPAGWAGQVVSLSVLLVVSTLVLLGVDWVGRRFVPLATLLDLSMLFPDQAPSRVKVAREAIKGRPIEEQLQRVRDAGADPGAVAREILTLIATLSAHDKPTRGHAERVRMFTDLLAEQMRVPKRDRDLLRWAAILHDIGKLHVPSELLNKPGKPTEEEWEVLKSHPSHGADIAAGLLPWLGEWGDCIVQHHERYDGTGYPNGISGAQISLGARIVSVADAYDVMTAARAYKRPVSRSAALAELVKWSGRQFDPVVVRAMVAVGQPRLRRAQGVVSWIADIPLVASGTVPAATVARLIGAGALATGAVTGGVAVADAREMAPRAEIAAAVADSSPGSTTASTERGPDLDRASRLEADPVAQAPNSTTSRADVGPGVAPASGDGASEAPAHGDGPVSTGEDPAGSVTSPRASGPETTRSPGVAAPSPASEPLT